MTLRSEGGKLLWRSGHLCSTCCDVGEDEFAWRFVDIGFIAGGQSGARREYNDPSEVSASPWSREGGALRLDFEDDYNCQGYNNNVQLALAQLDFTLATPAQLRLSWYGWGEAMNENFEFMAIDLDGHRVTTGGSAGGFQDCGAMAPCWSSPPGPVALNLATGFHQLVFDCNTGDNLFHVGAYWAFEYVIIRPLSATASAKPPAPMAPMGSISRDRFEVCKGCENGQDNGFACALHKGCCFGRFRAQPTSRCPAGKW